MASAVALITALRALGTCMSCDNLFLKIADLTNMVDPECWNSSPKWLVWHRQWLAIEANLLINSFCERRTRMPDAGPVMDFWVQFRSGNEEY